MRIDLVFPRFKIISGAERLILELAGSLARAGHRPRIVCHRFDDSCCALVAEGVEVVATGARLDWSRSHYLNAFADYARARRLARHVDADVVVLYGPALPAARHLQRAGLRVVYHCFEPPRALYQDRAAVLRRLGVLRYPVNAALELYRRLDRRLVARVAAITASGVYAAGRVREIYGSPAVPITHGVDRPALDAAVAAASAPRHDFVTVNFLHPRKRVDLVIRALERLGGGDGAAPNLLIVGDGPERAALERLANELGLERRVRFAGFVVEQDLPALYCRARAYVHAAREESFGLSVIEAAYCGLPVVAVAEGGVVDNVIDGDTGYLVEASAEALAQAMERVLADADAASAMGGRGRDLVADRYDWDRGAADLLAAIERGSV